ncbi:phosphotransferase family protein [Microbacterium halophytorum]|uniref:phosphotransferase family protein n=1 Tax=Microbacterium halophytorum TaxID=2067568 RepID=UPI001319F832|nr:aminoglycoside phosphotransferase family protein [Microbacterium halophytorum]
MNPSTMTAGDAVAALIERDPSLPELAVVLDDDARADAFGRRLEIERLRYKPGAAILAAVRDAAGDRYWIASYADPDKLVKSADRARRAGAVTFAPTARVLSGPAYADRLLVRRVMSHYGDRAATLAGARIVRYNPLRRLVVRDGASAVKFAAEEAPMAAASALAAAGLPVLAPVRLGDGVSSTPWWGADLDASPESAARAGEALAGIHLVSPPALPVADPAREAGAAGQAIAAVLPELAGRARRVADRIARGPFGRRRAFCHGDFTADQVLSDGSGIRIIDLDRAQIAAPESDLGSFLACGGEPSLLDGYRAAGGRVDEAAMRNHRALAILQRAIEPFRTAPADWPARVEGELARAEEDAG